MAAIANAAEADIRLLPPHVRTVGLTSVPGKDEEQTLFFFF
jgi:hypothetical protein